MKRIAFGGIVIAVMCIAALLLFSSDSVSQNPEWINYTNGDNIYAIVADQDYLWIGTDGGLVRLNKNTEQMTFYNPSNSGLPDNHVRALAVDSKCNLWVGTYYSGLAKFDGTTWTVYTPDNSDLPWIYITEIEVDDKDNIWIGSGDCITIFTGNNWHSYKTDRPIDAYVAIHDIEFDSKGSACIAASWGLALIKNNELIKIQSDIFREIYSLAIDKNDTIWIGTKGKGLVKYDGEYWTVYDTSNSDIPSNVIYDLEFDSEGTLWCTTPTAIAKFDGKRWETYNHENSELPDEIYFSLENDNNNDVLWIGTLGYGVYKYDGKKWKQYKTSNSGLLNNFINLLASDEQGNIWITFYPPCSNALRFDGKKWELYGKEDVAFFEANFRCIYEADSVQIWKGSGIVIQFIGTSYCGVHSMNIRHGMYLQIDSQGNIWRATQRGLMKYDGTHLTIYNKDNSPLPSNFVSELAFDDRGNLWIGTYPYTEDIGDSLMIPTGGGLARFDGENWVVFNKENSVLKTNLIHDIEIDQSGNLWIAEDGLIKYDGEKWQRYNMYNSNLPDNAVTDICCDKYGNLWIGTDNGGGLAKFDSKGNWTIYNMANSGLPSRFEIYPIEIDLHDNVWMGVWWDGLVVFREGGVILSDVNETDNPTPTTSFLLTQNYPNPFNSNTTIFFTIHQNSHVRITIYDLLGRFVADLTDKKYSPGTYYVLWDGKDSSNNPVSSGVYVYVLKINTQTVSKKMILLR